MVASGGVSGTDGKAAPLRMINYIFWRSCEPYRRTDECSERAALTHFNFRYRWQLLALGTEHRIGAFCSCLLRAVKLYCRSNRLKAAEELIKWLAYLSPAHFRSVVSSTMAASQLCISISESLLISHRCPNVRASRPSVMVHAAGKNPNLPERGFFADVDPKGMFINAIMPLLYTCISCWCLTCSTWRTNLAPK